MDGVESLLLKWDEMKNWQRAIVLILVLGALAYAIDQILGFINKWILPIPAYIQTIIHILPGWISTIISLVPFEYLPIIFLYTVITIALVQRAQDKAKTDIKTEIANLVNLIKKLTAQLGKDNKEKQANRPN